MSAVMEESDERLLSTASAAHFLDVTPFTLRKWRLCDAGPPYIRMPNGRTIRYQLTELRRWAGLDQP